MADTKPVWRKSRGKLGILDPLLGDWEAEAGSPQGSAHCVRSFRRVLGGKYVQLAARRELPGQVAGAVLALFGVAETGGSKYAQKGRYSWATRSQAGSSEPGG